VCAGAYYVVVSPLARSEIACGSPYVLTFDCGAPPLPLCCKADMNNDSVKNGNDISLFVSTLLNPPINSMPVTGCYDVNTCRADLNGDYAVTVEDITGFVDAIMANGVCSASLACGIDPERCHRSAHVAGDMSDLNSSVGGSQRLADDFMPDVSGTVGMICWYGFYLNIADGITCSQGESVPDDFCITLYHDNAGTPGQVFAGPRCESVQKIDTGIDISVPGFGLVREYRYFGPFFEQFVVSGGCYWIEIVNKTSGGCAWYWSSGVSSNDVSAQSSGDPAGNPNYSTASIRSNDYAFCLGSVRINEHDCGPRLGRCCYDKGASCEMTDYVTCRNTLGGSWDPGATCLDSCRK